MQLLAVVIPRIEEWQKQGEIGQRKITQWTRYVTIVLALIQSTGLVFLFHNPENFGVDLIPNFTPQRIALIVLTMTAGTGLIMWLGELITQRGIGNGMSILIFASVISDLPGSLQRHLLDARTHRRGSVPAVRSRDRVRRRPRRTGPAPDPGPVRETDRRAPDDGRRVDLYPDQGQPGRGHPDHLRVVGDVHPRADLQRCAVAGPADFVQHYFVKASSIPYILMFFLLILAFTFFYVAITFNPVQQADYIRKYGGFIPGIRPGRPTAEYLNRVLTRLTIPGSLFLAAVAIIPSIVAATDGHRRVGLPLRRDVDPDRRAVWRWRRCASSSRSS